MPPIQWASKPDRCLAIAHRLVECSPPSPHKATRRSLQRPLLQNGGENAFLDSRTIAKVHLVDPTMTNKALISLYVDRVPTQGYRGSCIFHGRNGCTLDRSMRADVCNTYFCRGLGDYVRSRVAPEPTIVIAGDGETMQVSPVLMPSA